MDRHYTIHVNAHNDHADSDSEIMQRSLITDEETPGLDFFLQTSGNLRQRYNATATDLDGGRLKIELIPVTPTEEVARAEVVLDGATGLVESLRYDDAEGNVTVFEIRGYEPGARRGIFLPPPDMQWEDP